MGFYDIEEDFAGWLILNNLEKKGHHQTVRQSFMDFLRKWLGDKRYKFSQDPILYRTKLKEETIQAIMHSQRAQDWLKNGCKLDLKLDFQKLYKILSQKDSELLGHYLNGSKLKEIGLLYSVTESRAKQMLSNIETKMRNAIKLTHS